MLLAEFSISSLWIIVKQFLMAAHLCKNAINNDYYLVCINNCRKSVGNNDDGNVILELTKIVN